MREARFAGFVVVLAKIPGGVEKLARLNGGFKPYFVEAVEDPFAGGAGYGISLVQGIVESGPGCLQAAIAAGKEQAHVGRDARSGHAVVSRIVLRAEEQRVRGIEVNNAALSGESPDAGHVRLELESYQPHRCSSVLAGLKGPWLLKAIDFGCQDKVILSKAARSMCPERDFDL